MLSTRSTNIILGCQSNVFLLPVSVSFGKLTLHNPFDIIGPGFRRNEKVWADFHRYAVVDADKHYPVALVLAEYDIIRGIEREQDAAV